MTIIGIKEMSDFNLDDLFPTKVSFEENYQPEHIRNQPEQSTAAVEVLQITTNKSLEEITDLKDLFIQARQEERFRIDRLNFETDGYQILQTRLEQLERIIMEAKGRATELAFEVRKQDGKRGTNRYEKEAGKLNKSHLKNVEGLGSLKAETKKHQKGLTQCEKSIAGFVEIGTETDESIISMFEKKYKLAEIKAAIAKARESEKSDES